MTDKIQSPEEILSGETTIFLATLDEDQPRVRPVTLVESEGELFVLTGSKDNKIAQIQIHNKVDILTLVKHGERTGYLRFTAKATIEDNPKIRARAAKTASFFNQFWDSPDHSGFALLRIQPIDMEYMKPGEFAAKPVKKLNFVKK